MISLNRYITRCLNEILIGEIMLSCRKMAIFKAARKKTVLLKPINEIHFFYILTHSSRLRKAFKYMYIAILIN